MQGSAKVIPTNIASPITSNLYSTALGSIPGALPFPTMNCLSSYYGSEDGRYQAAKVIETVLSFAIENLADGRGGTITLLPVNELEDLTVIYRSECGGIQIGQMSIQDDEATSVDIMEDDVKTLMASIRSI
jgi:hypothetical protein